MDEEKHIMAHFRLIHLSTRIFVFILLLCTFIFAAYAVMQNMLTVQSIEIHPKAMVSLPLIQTAGPITGDYDGTVTLQRVFNGVYSDTVTVSNTLDLGYIDLALHLEQSGNVVNGFVTLDRTLVFTEEHKIMATPVGPPVGQGTPTPVAQEMAIGPKMQPGKFDGTTLLLESQPFTMTLSEEIRINGESISPARTVIRQFRLITTNVQGDGATLTGEYRETIWGYAAYPTTVIGTFTLQRPVFGVVADPEDTPTPMPGNNKVFLPLVTR